MSESIKITKAKKKEYKQVRLKTRVGEYETLKRGESVFVECDHANDVEMHKKRALVYYHSGRRTDGNKLTSQQVIHEKSGKTGLIVSCVKA